MKATGKFSRTVLFLASVIDLLGFTERVHEIGQTGSIEMRRMVGEQRSDEFAEAQIKE